LLQIAKRQTKSPYLLLKSWTKGEKVRKISHILLVTWLLFNYIEMCSELYLK
jgi:hypothetical protein